MDLMPTIPTCTNKIRFYFGYFLSSKIKAYFSLVLVTMLFALSLTSIKTTFAQEEAQIPSDGTEITQVPLGEYIPNAYMLGEVIRIAEEGEENLGGFEEKYQLVLVKIVTGDDAGEVETIEYRSSAIGFEQVRLEEGDPVVLVKTTDARGSVYFILDQWRLPVVIVLAIVFGALAILLGKWRGGMSLVGLGVSLIVLAGFVAPRIMSGDDPDRKSVV